MRPLIDLINAAPELSDESQVVLLEQIRSSDLLLGWFATIRNTADQMVREMENVNLTTEEGVKAAMHLQGKVKGIRVFLETVIDWDTTFLANIEQQAQEGEIK